MSLAATTKNFKLKDVIWQQYRLCLAMAAYHILAISIFLFWDRVRKDFVVEQGTIPSEKVPPQVDTPARQAAQVDFSQSRQSFACTGVSTSLV